VRLGDAPVRRELPISSHLQATAFIATKSVLCGRPSLHALRLLPSHGHRWLASCLASSARQRSGRTPIIQGRYSIARRSVRDGVPSDWPVSQGVRQIYRRSCGRSEFWPVAM